MIFDLTGSGRTILVKTLAADLPGAIVRLVVVWGLLHIQQGLGVSWWPLAFGILAAVAPYGLALMTLCFGGGSRLSLFYYWMTARARRPTLHEVAMVSEVFGRFTSQGVAVPRHWYVVDLGEFNAFVCGSCLYLDTSIFRTPYLAAVLAHEMGHFNSSDGKLLLARARLVTGMLLYDATEAIEQLYAEDLLTRAREEKAPSISMWIFCRICYWLCWFAGGGLGLFLSQSAWRDYWKEREFEADTYAAALGHAPDLADALSMFHLADAPLMLPPPSPEADTHPPTDERIRRLRQYRRP